jgi:hypothetical protein
VSWTVPWRLQQPAHRLQQAVASLLGHAPIGRGTAVAVAARTMPATPPTVLSTATTVGHAADTHTHTHAHDSSHCVAQNNICSSKQHSSSNSHKPKAWQQHSIPSQPSMRMHAPATILQQHHHAMQHHAIMMQQQQQQVIHQRMQQLQLWQQQQQHNQHQCGKKQWLLKCSRFLSLLK